MGGEVYFMSKKDVGTKLLLALPVEITKECSIALTPS
jgi:hypothetical protein